MGWRLRSYPSDDPDSRRVRGGLLLLAEGMLFLITAATMLGAWIDFARRGSLWSLYIAVLLFSLTFWPRLRHRLWHGDWPP